MHDWRVTAAKFRAAAHSPDDVPIKIEHTLQALYRVAIVRLSGLRVGTIQAWLDRHGSMMPSSLVTCADRRLRGGLIAWRGCTVIFTDREDPEDEQQFSVAHEAGHYLGDHLYPRMDLLERLGPGVLPVLDGRRHPTVEERVDALLARAPLSQLSHLLSREEPILPDIQASEADADLFAREILAPVAAIRRHFSQEEMSADVYHNGIGGSRSLRPTAPDRRPGTTRSNAADPYSAPYLLQIPPTVLTACPTSEAVAEHIMNEFFLPASQARLHARTFLAEHVRPTGLLHRLGLA